MPLPDKNSIDALSEDNLAMLAEVDSSGFLMAPGENISDYKKRLLEMQDSYAEIEKDIQNTKEYNIYGEFVLNTEKRINAEILDEAAELTGKYYDFSINWVPGFFLSKSLGFLWGGCAISFPENQVSVFIIRANFAVKKRWLFYRRDELLAHELCHVARMPVKDRTFEELFAYRLSPSRLRRYMGNCFRHDYDAVLFIIPIFLLLAAQVSRLFFNLERVFPIWPFWIIAASYPLFLLVRNHFNRNIFFKAKRNLEKAGAVKPLPVLFRCSKEELSEISELKKPDELKKWINGKSESELRWKVMKFRFF